MTERDCAAWKAEAIEVIERWDLVYDALGRPGGFGVLKSEASRKEAERLVARVAELETAQRLTYSQLTSIWDVGSGAWSWDEELARFVDPNGPHLQVFAGVFASVAIDGIQEPVLLGPDRRVWDGHHRIVAARFLDVSIPYTIGFGTGGS